MADIHAAEPGSWVIFVLLARVAPLEHAHTRRFVAWRLLVSARQHQRAGGRR